MQAGKKHTDHPVATGTDWERVKREAAQDAPIAFDADSEPYNLNDEQAVTAYWSTVTIKRGRGRLVACWWCDVVAPKCT